MTEIRHIVFDIGRVLIQWDPELPYRRLLPDAEERRRFLAEICTSAWNPSRTAAGAGRTRRRS